MEKKTKFGKRTKFGKKDRKFVKKTSNSIESSGDFCQYISGRFCKGAQCEKLFNDEFCNIKAKTDHTKNSFQFFYAVNVTKQTEIYKWMILASPFMFFSHYLCTEKWFNIAVKTKKGKYKKTGTIVISTEQSYAKNQTF